EQGTSLEVHEVASLARQTVIDLRGRLSAVDLMIVDPRTAAMSSNHEREVLWVDLVDGTLRGRVELSFDRDFFRELCAVGGPPRDGDVIALGRGPWTLQLAPRGAKDVPHIVEYARSIAALNTLPWPKGQDMIFVSATEISPWKGVVALFD